MPHRVGLPQLLPPALPTSLVFNPHSKRDVSGESLQTGPGCTKQGDPLLPSGSWGVAVLRQFLPKGLEEELLFDSISSKALKRPFLTAPGGAPAVCAAVLQPPLALVLLSARGWFPAGRGGFSAGIIPQEWDGAHRSFALLKISPPGLTPSTQNTSHQHWQLPPRAAHTTHRCWYHPAELAVPGAHGHGTLLPGSAHPTSAASSQSSCTRSVRCKASMHPSQPSPAIIPGAQPGTHRRWSLGEGSQAGKSLEGGEKAMEQRSSERARPVKDRARKGCLSRGARVPLTP